MKKHYKLAPGEYSKRGRRRLLLATVGNNCIYTFDNIGSEVLHLTSCSARTFAHAVGSTAASVLSQDDLDALIKRSISLRSFKYSNSFQRKTFFDVRRKYTSKKFYRPVSSKSSWLAWISGWFLRSLRKIVEMFRFENIFVRRSA